MNLLRYFFLNIFLLLTIIASSQNDPAISKIIDLGKTENKVMDHIDFLTNRFGDRITGSDGYYSACTWAVNTMKSWGMMAEMQEAGEMVSGTNAVDFVHTLGKDGLLKGLNEALLTMKRGERRILIVPPDLAYGINTGYYGKDIAGQKRFVISPGETLILEVTLIKFDQ